VSRQGIMGKVGEKGAYGSKSHRRCYLVVSRNGRAFFGETQDRGVIVVVMIRLGVGSKKNTGCALRQGMSGKSWTACCPSFSQPNRVHS
jgi:hypothetical protein